jgi:putative transposase
LPIPNNAILGGFWDEMEVDFVEREATPILFMNLNIQLHFAGLSLLNTVFFLKYLVFNAFVSLCRTWFNNLIYNQTPTV